MLVPVVVHWLVPLQWPITDKLPDASIFHLALSYFKDIELDVFSNGLEKVNLFCFVLINVVDLGFKLFIDNNEFVDKLLKLLKFSGWCCL